MSMHIRCLVLGELETNCYIVWADNGEGIVIDPADDAHAIIETAEKEGVTVQAVVLTHVHFDHMLAAEKVCAVTGAPLYVGVGDVDALDDPDRNLSVWFSADHPLTLPADRTLKEGDKLSFGPETLEVWETPGHTPGCICLLADGIVFSGDTLFCGAFGRLDFPGGDPRAMVRSLHRLAGLPDSTEVYSGHGPVTTIGTEARRYNSFR